MDPLYLHLFCLYTVLFMAGTWLCGLTVEASVLHWLWLYIGEALGVVLLHFLVILPFVLFPKTLISGVKNEGPC